MFKPSKREIRWCHTGREALERLEGYRDALTESYGKGGTRRPRPEERHLISRLHRLGIRFRPDWPLEITGVFTEVREEAESGLSSCKPSSLGV